MKRSQTQPPSKREPKAWRGGAKLATRGWANVDEPSKKKAKKKNRNRAEKATGFAPQKEGKAFSKKPGGKGHTTKKQDRRRDH